MNKNYLEIDKKTYDELVALLNSKQYDELEKKLEKLLLEHPKSFILFNLQGMLKKIIGKNLDAIKSFKNAIKINPNVVESHNNLGALQLELNKFLDAKESLENAIKIKNNFFEAYNNLGILYKNQKKFNKAINFFKRCIELNKEHNNAYYNLGETYDEIGDLEHAILNYKNSLKINPNDYAANYNIGDLFLRKKKFRDAVSFFKKAYDLNQRYTPALASYIFCKMSLCDWSALEDFEKVKNDIGIKGEPIHPFYTLNLIDDPKNLQIRSQNWSRSNFKNDPDNLISSINAKNEKIKLGYFSSDFHNHAMLLLMRGQLKTHDTNKFEIYLFGFGNPPQSNLFDEIKNKNNIYIDLSDKSDDEAVELVRNKKLDFAVDLNGFTTNSRTNIFAKKIAPVQINFLGYSGTMGSDFMNYIIADEVLIDEKTRKFYQEKVIFMPNSYQPNDDERLISETKSSRNDHGLKDNDVVICCFNNTYKITKYEFDVWLRILKKVDNAILWLLDTNEEVKININNYVSREGVDPKRIIYAKRINYSKYLERLKHADIFVDTFNYNAHTTCSDALWSGVPVVTKKGKQFSSRVASSLLTAVGMKELISNSVEEYEKIILDLALNQNKLQKCKNKLKKDISLKPLFNTKNYTKNFENCLEKIYKNRLNKLEDQDISIKQ